MLQKISCRDRVVPGKTFGTPSHGRSGMQFHARRYPSARPGGARAAIALFLLSCQQPYDFVRSQTAAIDDATFTGSIIGNDGHAAVLLSNGSVLYVGGNDGTGAA